MTISEGLKSYSSLGFDRNFGGEEVLSVPLEAGGE